MHFENFRNEILRDFPKIYLEKWYVSPDGTKLFPEVYFENHWKNKLLNLWIEQRRADIVLDLISEYPEWMEKVGKLMIFI